MKKLIPILFVLLFLGCEKEDCYFCQTTANGCVVYSVDVCDKTEEEIDIMIVGMDAQYYRLTKGEVHTKCIKK